MTETRPTHDAAYKHLFTQPRMVQDLLERMREGEEAEEGLKTVIDLLKGQENDELRRAFSAWARQALMPAGFRPKETEPLAQLEELRSMLAENVQEWTREWVAQGREEGREEERNLLCRLAARKFDADAAGQPRGARPRGPQARPASHYRRSQACISKATNRSAIPSHQSRRVMPAMLH